MEFDIGIEFDIEKELFNFENEFDMENEPTTNHYEMNGPNGLQHFIKLHQFMKK